jgi:S1-C subfamily serine protease
MILISKRQIYNIISLLLLVYVYPQQAMDESPSLISDIIIPSDYIQSYQNASFVIGELKKRYNNPVKNERTILGGSRLYTLWASSVMLLISDDLKSIGAGSLIDEKGRILTSWHLVKDKKQLLVWSYNPEILKFEDLAPAKHGNARVIAKDKSRDLALLQLAEPLEGSHPLIMGNEKSVKVASDIFTIGHPEQYIWSFSRGVVSQFRKNHKWFIDHFDFLADVIQTQTPVSPGNSGGPVFNRRGRLIGIHSYRSVNTGINFAISINEIRSFLNASDQWAEPDTISLLNQIMDKQKPVIKMKDTDGDGKTDVLQVDFDQDGFAEINIYDKDNNGSFEYYEFDDDDDGIIDEIGIDTNNDGKPDHFVRDTMP